VPAVGNGTTLGDVAMVSPHDVWEVGEFRNAHGRGRSLALHRTNAGWHHVPTPNLGTGENDLYRIIAVGPSDVWAAGLGTVGGVARAIVVRWNGTKWNRIAFPAVGTGDNYLEGIAASRSTGVWVAVEYIDGGTDRAAVFHRTGSTWHRVPFAQLSAGNVQPRDLIAAGSSVWMTGFYRKAGKTVGLLARWNGGHWELFDGVNPTSSTYLEGLATVWPHVVTYGHLVTSSARGVDPTKLRAPILEAMLLQSGHFPPDSQPQCQPANREWDYVCSYMPKARQSSARLQFGVDVDSQRWTKVASIVAEGTPVPAPQ